MEPSKVDASPVTPNQPEMSDSLTKSPAGKTSENKTNDRPAMTLPEKERPSVHPAWGETYSDVRWWQRRLLPFMIVILTVSTLFFLVGSYIQLNNLNNRIKEGHPKIELDPALASLDKLPPDAADNTKLNFAMWKTLATLEKSAMERRYYHAGVMIMARVWTRYLGFVTGMILALVGATFILGKMKETESRMVTSSELWKASVTTASPGIILALLGSILILTTMLTTYEIRVDDEKIFTNVKMETVEATPTPYPPPAVR